jgi:hypothetical protein
VIEVPLEGGPVEIRGAIDFDHTACGILPRRLGPQARSQIPDDFMSASVGQSAGIRLAFRTAASAIELTVRATKMVEDDTSIMPAAPYDLVVDGRLVQQQLSTTGNRCVFSFERPEAYVIDGPAETLRFNGLPTTEKNVEIWLPYTDEVELLSLRADKPVDPPALPRGIRWLHHGSSISHGYRASHTTATWPVAAALAAGVQLTNLSFSGNAMLDQLTARTIRDAPADVISLKLGINLVNGDMMRLRVFRTAVHGFLDTIRDGHPTTSLLVISPIFCAPVEDVAGPTIQDPARTQEWVATAGDAQDIAEGKLSLQVIRAELERTVRERARSDPSIFYLDGLRLYGSSDAELMPLPDNLHPADDAQRLMTDRFVTLAFGESGPFACCRAR